LHQKVPISGRTLIGHANEASAGGDEFDSAPPYFLAPAASAISRTYRNNTQTPENAAAILSQHDWHSRCFAWRVDQMRIRSAA
jgi:hypothetical protein